MMLVGQPKLLKEVNRDTIKDLIFEQGPMTKPELSRMTNLSLPTVNKIVDGLEQDGIIRQDGTTGSSSGKKAKLYAANENAGNVIVLYYLDGEFRGHLVNAIGSMVSQASVEVDSRTAQTALDSTFTLIGRLMEQSEAEIRAIGIGVPGVVKIDKRVTNITSIPGWTNIKLEEIVAARYKVPVFVENDVKLTTVGYYHAHLENTCRDMVYFYIGKGIGSGIIINGSLHKGFSSFAGELGYLAPFEAEGQDYYAQGGGWFEDQMQGIFAADKASGSISGKYIRYIVVSMIDYIVTINPEVMVLQGKWLDEDAVGVIKEGLRKYIPDESLPQIYVNSDLMCGTHGLINLCLAGLSTSKKLVLTRSI